MNLMRLPWEGKSTPHGTLDIMGSCNIHCRGCYNHRTGSPKPFDQIQRDLSQMLTHRRLHTVTLTGGEATMHPELTRIVEHVSSLGIKAAVVTNASLLDEVMVRNLKRAGISLIIVHIQVDQERPDLPHEPTISDASALRQSKLKLIADCGVEAGAAYTIYNDRIDEFEQFMTELLADRRTSFALLTMHSDFSKFVELTGSVESGLRGKPQPSNEGDLSIASDDVPVEKVLTSMSRLGLEPFSYVAANTDITDRRWYLFLAGSVVHDDGSYFHHSLQSSLLERALIKLSILTTGRTPFFYKPSRLRFKTQIALNALLGGDIKKNIALLCESRRNSGVLEDKHILLQRAPEIAPDGTVTFCRGCPDSTIRKGVMLPACLVDRMAQDELEVPV